MTSHLVVRRCASWPWLWLLIGVLGSAPSATAFQTIPLSAGQLAAASELIIHGQVLAKSCQKDATGRVFTKVELAVSEVWKGSVASNQFTIVHGGGVLGQRRVVVSGQVDYHVGEEVVAFVIVNERGEGVTLSLAQGKFTVYTDGNGQKMVYNPFLGAPPAAGSPTSPAPPQRSPMSLVELKRQALGGVR